MHKVKVCVRCRPILRRESGKNHVELTDKKVLIRMNDTKEFGFDEVYNENSTQKQIFDTSIKALVDGCFDGYNATVFAYGQSGTGKTHTMGTSIDSVDVNRPDDSLLSDIDAETNTNGGNIDDIYSGDGSEEGIVPRAVRYLFRLVDKQRKINNSAAHSHSHSHSHSSSNINIRVCFIEIYNEECIDLLHMEVPSKDILIREDRDGRIFFIGAREEAVRSVDEVFYYLQRGCVNRTTGATGLNDSSSRSHAIFTISLEMIKHGQDKSGKGETAADDGSVSGSSGSGSGHTKLITSKLHLVDLAGSERAKRTGAKGVRLKESVGINQGLMSLGKVIRALTVLSEQQQQQQRQGEGSALLIPSSVHVPYRESKLTRFLQDSLGGNSRTVMIACISPSDGDLQETLSTLQYAAKTRLIQNKVSANVSTLKVTEPTVAATSGVKGVGSSSTQESLYQQQQQQQQQQRDQEEIINKLMDQVASLQQELQQQTGTGAGGVSQFRRSLEGGLGLGLTLPGSSSAAAIQEIERQHLRINSELEQAVTGLLECADEADVDLSDHSQRECVKLVERLAHSSYAVVKQLARVQLQQEELFQLCERSIASVAAASAAEAVAAAAINAPKNNSPVVTMKKATVSSTTASQPNPLSSSLVFEQLSQQSEIARLREELQVCRDDLVRDEEIFEEKVRTVKALKKTNRALETEKQEVEARLVSLQGQFDAMLQMQLHNDQRSNHDNQSSSPSQSRQLTATPTASTVSTTIRALTPTVTAGTPIKHVDDRTPESPSPLDLELSRVIDGLMPPTADLYQDLEELQQEKEKLAREKEEMEMKCIELGELASKQKAEHDTQRSEYKRKLKELEIGIRMKQDVIVSVTKAQSSASQASERYAQKASELEAQTVALKHQLRQLETEMRQHEMKHKQAVEQVQGLVLDEQKVEEERREHEKMQQLYTSTREELERVKAIKRKKEYEYKELDSKQRQEKRDAEAVALELKQMKQAYKKVQHQLEAEEQRQNKYLDVLQSELTSMRKDSTANQGEIKRLEKRNEELLQRLERAAAGNSSSNNYYNNNSSGRGHGSSSVSSRADSKSVRNNHSQQPPQLPYGNSNHNNRGYKDTGDDNSVISGVTTYSARTHGNDALTPLGAEEKPLVCVGSSSSSSSGGTRVGGKGQRGSTGGGASAAGSAGGGPVEAKATGIPSRTVSSPADHITTTSPIAAGGTKTAAVVDLNKWFLQDIRSWVQQSLVGSAEELLKKEHDDLKMEKQALKKQLKDLQSERQQKERSIKQQIAELITKIEKLNGNSTNTTATGGGSTSVSHEKQLRRYSEHLDELQQRHESNVLTAEEQHRVAELVDEIEQVEVRLALNETYQVEAHQNKKALRSGRKLQYTKPASITMAGLVPPELVDLLTHDITGGLSTTASGGGSSKRQSQGQKKDNFKTNMDTGSLIALKTEVQESLQAYVGSSGVTAEMLLAFQPTLVMKLVEVALAYVRAHKEAQESQAQLEATEEEREQLATQFHLFRVDSQKRVDGARREQEDKIAYLLSQLRVLEGKLQEGQQQQQQQQMTRGSETQKYQKARSSPRRTQHMDAPHGGDPSCRGGDASSSSVNSSEGADDLNLTDSLQFAPTASAGTGTTASDDDHGMDEAMTNLSSPVPTSSIAASISRSRNTRNVASMNLNTSLSRSTSTSFSDMNLSEINSHLQQH